ncbi:FAD binding domain-containing protein [Gorillibacterium sp. sgz5001074]|uniref:FAD binding domain-containing protein n=1 Tax=Gorillibacterium sp. sgz5001074 TaxID=3446695 RepID=UPI003F6639FF
MAMESERLSAGGKKTVLWRPNTLEEAWQCKRRFGEAALYVAGGTWLRTRWEAELAPMPEHVVSLESIAALRSLHLQRDGHLTVGSAVRMAELLKHEAVRFASPLLRMAAAKIAAPSVRNQATVGGNVMTGTGDLLPALLASDAVLMVYDGRRTDRIPVSDWLSLSFRPAELLLVGMKLPALPASAVPFFHKIGRRERFSPAVLTVSGWFQTGEGGRIDEVRLAAGGGSMRPLRLKRSEEVARWSHPDQAAPGVYLAVEAEMPDFSDDYAPAVYRKRTAANLTAAELYRLGRRGGDGHEDGS